MAKKDIDLYHSQLTPDDLNDLIIKYKIPRDLHPQLPSEDFVIFELLDDAIGIYHRLFDFSYVQISFSSFLLALIKHYKIESTHWKSGFFFIDRRAISDAMVWRHPDVAIDDPRPAAGSLNMADVRRLSAHVIKLRDMPEGVLVLSGLIIGIYGFLCLPGWTDAEVQEEPHLDVRSTLQTLPFYCTPPATADAVILKPTLEDLVVSTPSSKIVAKAEASQKRKAFTSGATSSHVAKRTRPALAQLFDSTTRPSLLVGDDDESDDDDACVEILLVTPLRFTVAFPSLGNQGRSSATPTAEGSNLRGRYG
ncbi:hypothetical protein Tco_1052690 [Tanacetum coccineum]